MKKVTVEGMIAALADDEMSCPKKGNLSKCHQYLKSTDERTWNGCEDCWRALASEDEIRTAYEELVGREGD